MTTQTSSSTSNLQRTRGQRSIVLAGCGAIVEALYVPALRNMPELLSGLYLADPDPKRLKKIAGLLGVTEARCVSDYRTLLDTVKPDGAIVTTPPDFHHAISMAFLTRGAHVLCEKPLSEIASEAEEMVATARANNAKLCVNMTRRLFPSYQHIKKMIVNGELGDLTQIDYRDGELFTWPVGPNFFKPRPREKGGPGGVLIERGIHALDVICWWLGAQPELVHAEHDSFGGPEGHVELRMRHAGCDARLKLSRLIKYPSNGFRVTGTRGSVHAGIEDFDQILFTNASGTKPIKIAAREKYYADFGAKLLKNFAAVVAGTETPAVPAEETLPATRIIARAYATATPAPQPWYDAVRAEMPEVIHA
jgi:predicted dehydrogenase